MNIQVYIKFKKKMSEKRSSKHPKSPTVANVQSTFHPNAKFVIPPSEPCLVKILCQEAVKLYYPLICFRERERESRVKNGRVVAGLRGGSSPPASPVLQLLPPGQAGDIQPDQRLEAARRGHSSQQAGQVVGGRFFSHVGWSRWKVNIPLKKYFPVHLVFGDLELEFGFNLTLMKLERVAYGTFVVK